jgi:hypothetical protein
MQTVSFGNEAVFPFPAVQYIPLQLSEVCQSKIPILNTSSISVQLHIGKDLEKWRPILWQNYQINLQERLPENVLPILVLNAKVNSARYRGYFITMLGNSEKETYHLFTLPKQYFYKNQLYFELYDESSNKRLARAAYSTII